MSDLLDTSALDALRESTGNDAAFVAELVATFLEESPGQLAELRAAVHADSGDDIRRGAHTLKSNAATFGVVRLTNASRELENRAAAGDLQGSAQLVDEIDAALTEARPALEALVAEGVA